MVAYRRVVVCFAAINIIIEIDGLVDGSLCGCIGGLLFVLRQPMLLLREYGYES